MGDALLDVLGVQWLQGGRTEGVQSFAVRTGKYSSGLQVGS